MARTSSAKVSNQGRSTIRNPNINLNKDDGTILISIVEGEKLSYTMTFNWLTGTDRTGHTVEMKVVEGNNAGDGEVPETERTSGVVTNFGTASGSDNTISYIADSDPHQYKFTLPHNMISTWTTRPTPGKPVYGFFDVEVTDGDQIWKPVRGLIEVLYSATE